MPKEKQKQSYSPLAAIFFNVAPVNHTVHPDPWPLTPFQLVSADVQKPHGAQSEPRAGHDGRGCEKCARPLCASSQ